MVLSQSVEPVVLSEYQQVPEDTGLDKEALELIVTIAARNTIIDIMPDSVAETVTGVWMVLLVI